MFGASFVMLSRRGSENWLLYFNCLLAVVLLVMFVSLPRAAVVWSVTVTFPSFLVIGGN